MKIFNSRQKKYIMYMLALIFLCELLLNIDGMFFKAIGILILPFIIAFCLLVFKNDKETK